MSTWVEIREWLDRRPNGDRDRGLHDCYKYDVLVINDAAVLPGNKIGKTEFVIQTFNQFDSFHCCINGSKREYAHNASVYGATIANAFGVKLTFVEFDPTNEDVILKKAYEKLSPGELALMKRDIQKS
jgi:hypothetical protein